MQGDDAVFGFPPWCEGYNRCWSGCDCNAAADCEIIAGGTVILGQADVGVNTYPLFASRMRMLESWESDVPRHKILPSLIPISIPEGSTSEAVALGIFSYDSIELRLMCQASGKRRGKEGKDVRFRLVIHQWFDSKEWQNHWSSKQYNTIHTYCTVMVKEIYTHPYLTDQ